MWASTKRGMTRQGGGREGDVRWRSGCLQQEVGMLKGYGGRALGFKGWGGASAV